MQREGFDIGLGRNQNDKKLKEQQREIASNPKLKRHIMTNLKCLENGKVAKFNAECH